MKIEDLENRFNHHPPQNKETSLKYEIIRHACLELAKMINNLAPESREKSTAITKLEEVMFWGNAAVVRNETVPNALD